jgi:hypothetical protein
MNENVRTIIIVVGSVVFAAGYLKLLANAFSRNVVWGVFSVFAPPIGGLLHGLTDWLENRLGVVLSLIGAGVVVYGLWYFPRPPLTGFWINETKDLVLRLDDDGHLHYFGLASDGRFAFRPVKVLTKELPIKSQVRLKLTGLKDLEVAYYDPRAATLKLFDGLHDPELFLFPESTRFGLHLSRVADVSDVGFRVLFDRLSQRKAVFEAAMGLIHPAEDGSDVINFVSDRLRERYQEYVRLARTGTLGPIEILPTVDQVYALRIRTVHAAKLQSSANADAILAADLKQDFFLAGNLTRYEMTDVVFDRAMQKANAIFDPLNPARLSRLSLAATRTRDNRWVLDVARLRDDDIEASIRQQGSSVTRLDAALQYLASSCGLARSKVLNYPGSSPR